jgi:Ni/Co efflux regulator RcnB
MRTIVAVIVFALVASPFALAQDKAKHAETKAPVAAEKSTKKEPSEKQKAHQARMKECAGKAEGRKGDERKAFMSTCLKG